MAAGRRADLLEPLAPVPPVWYFFPVTLLLAPILVGVHVHRMAGNHDRSERNQWRLASLSALVVAVALGFFGAAGRGAGTDNEWSSVGPKSTSDVRPLVLLVAWFVAVTAIYASAGLRWLAVVPPVAIALALFPPFVVEFGFSLAALNDYCAGGGQRPFVTHLALAALVPLAAVIVGLTRPRWSY